MSPAADQDAPLPPLVTLWVGSALNRIHTACLASAVRQGHRVALYCYDPPSGVPRGVELREARSILPESAVIRHANGSPAPFADRFRYELLRRGLGTWIDCDAYFLKPLDGSAPNLFGWQDERLINNGVLRLPADSPVLAALLGMFEGRGVPSWLPLRLRAAARWRLARSRHWTLGDLPWGSTGPIALTALLRKYGLDREALPPECLYPVPWPAAGWVFDADRALETMIAPRTVSVHLWASQLPADDMAAVKPGSFMARLVEEAEAACG